MGRSIRAVHWETITKHMYKKLCPWWHWWHTKLYPSKTRWENQQYGEDISDVWYCAKCDALYKVERDYFNKKKKKFYTMDRDERGSFSIY